MPSLKIELPDDIARHVKAKVASGAYADEASCVRDMLRNSIADEAEADAWLRHQVLPVLEAYDRNPQDVLTGDEVVRSITADLMKRKRRSA